MDTAEGFRDWQSQGESPASTRAGGQPGHAGARRGTPGQRGDEAHGNLRLLLSCS